MNATAVSSPRFPRLVLNHHFELVRNPLKNLKGLLLKNRKKKSLLSYLGVPGWLRQ